MRFTAKQGLCVKSGERGTCRGPFRANGSIILRDHQVYVYWDSGLPTGFSHFSSNLSSCFYRRPGF